MIRQHDSPFLLGLGQILVEGGAPEANRARAVAAVHELARRGARVILLPEALNLGWTHPSCHALAENIPDGETCQELSAVAKALGVFLAAGLVERGRDGKVYNAAVLIDDAGNCLLQHRKIHELTIAHACYDRGTRLQVVDTALGRIGLMICADGFAEHLAISRALAAMGASVILSPCAWAVPPDFDHEATPYGGLWRDSYAPVCKESSLVIAGCSNVGVVECGPWAGHACIGHSLVMGPDGHPLLTGPYGEEALLLVEITPAPAMER